MKSTAYKIRLDDYTRFTPPLKWEWLRGSNLWICLKGSGAVIAADGEYTIKGRSCFIFNEAKDYTGWSDPEDLPVIVGIHYSYIDSSGSVVPSMERPFYRSLDDLHFSMNIQQRMLHALQQTPRADAAANNWMSVLMMEIDRQDTAPQHAGISKEHVEAIDLLCTEIYENPGKDYRLNDMAARIECSRDHFTRLFRKIKQTTPQAFIVNTRIRAAKNLLRYSSFSVSHIAEIIGFNDIYYFSRQFKKKTGMSPSTYRIRVTQNTSSK
jgi:AraC family transcriptional regulator of arabinose operon